MPCAHHMVLRRGQYAPVTCSLGLMMVRQTLGTCRQGTGLSQCDLDSQHYRGSSHSELTGTTERGSDLISLQMCVAREEQTTDSLTFKSGNMAPHLK